MEKAAKWGVPVYATLAECVAAQHPDFLVSAVPWGVTPEVTRAAVSLETAILCETPPAPDVDGLRTLWAAVGRSGLVQVAEHSPLMPSHAARLAVLGTGAIGQVTQVKIS